MRWLMLVICLFSTPVLAYVEPVTGGDEFTGATYSGVAITSNDGDATLYFICESDQPLPRIVFKSIYHRFVVPIHAIPDPYELFSASPPTNDLHTRVDNESILEHTFIGIKKFLGQPTNGHGEFLLRSTLAYEGLVGPYPQTELYFVEDRDLVTGELVRVRARHKQSDETRAWRDSVPRAIVQQFLDGQTAMARVWTRGRQDTYKFSLNGIKSHQGTLSQCM